MNKQLVVRIALGLAIAAAMVFMVASPIHTAARGAIAQAPLTSGGGCSSNPHTAPVRNNACISDSYSYIYGDSYVGPWSANNSQFQACNLEVSVTGRHPTGAGSYQSIRLGTKQYNCLSAFQSGNTYRWTAPVVECNSYYGYGYYSSTLLEVTYNGQYMEFTDYSPVQYC
jgi:hypothetical protein